MTIPLFARFSIDFNSMIICLIRDKVDIRLIRLKNLLANICQTAPIAMWLRPGRTDFPTVIDEPMAEITAFFRRNDFPELHLDLFRILCTVDESHPVRQTDAMRICHDRRLSEHVSHDQIRTLASDTRKL